MLKYLLPIREKTIPSKLSAEEIVKELNSVTTDSSNDQNFYEEEACFVGKVDKSKFELTTIIHDKFGTINSIFKDRNGNLGNFYFNINGLIERAGKKSEVSVKISPTPFSLSVIYIFYVFVLFATLVSTIGSKSVIQILGSILQITGYYILILYPVYLFLFKYHSSKVIKKIESVVTNNSNSRN